MPLESNTQMATNRKKDNDVTIFQHDIIIIIFFYVAVFFLSILVTGPSFIST